MAHKLRAGRSHGSRFSEIDYARAIKGLNQYLGKMSGKSRHAEAFQTLGLDVCESKKGILVGMIIPGLPWRLFVFKTTCPESVPLDFSTRAQMLDAIADF